MQTLNSIAEIMTGQMALGKDHRQADKSNNPASGAAAGQYDAESAWNSDKSGRSDSSQRFDQVLEQKLKPVKNVEKSQKSDQKQAKSDKNSTEKAVSSDDARPEPTDEQVAAEAVAALIGQGLDQLKDTPELSEQQLKKLADAIEKLKDMLLTQEHEPAVGQIVQKLQSAVQTGDTEALKEGLAALAQKLQGDKALELPVQTDIPAAKEPAQTQAPENQVETADLSQPKLQQSPADIDGQSQKPVPQEQAPAEQAKLPEKIEIPKSVESQVKSAENEPKLGENNPKSGSKAEKTAQFDEKSQVKDPMAKVATGSDKAGESGQRHQSHNAESARQGQSLDETGRPEQGSSNSRESDAGKAVKISVDSEQLNLVDHTAAEGAKPVSNPSQAGTPLKEAVSADIDKGIVSQLQNSISNTVARGKNEVEIRLDPPELGRVSVKISDKAGELTGLLEVDRAQTRFEIERALPQIIRNMQQQGVQVKRIEVVLSDRGLADQQNFQDHFNKGQNPFQQNNPWDQPENDHYGGLAEQSASEAKTSGGGQHKPYSPSGLNMLV